VLDAMSRGQGRLSPAWQSGLGLVAKTALLLIVIWALTGAGYPWPLWVIGRGAPSWPGAGSSERIPRATAVAAGSAAAGTTRAAGQSTPGARTRTASSPAAREA
jgi:hypothetical protein